VSPFRLAALLRLRQRQQDDAAGDLARANAASRDAQELSRRYRQALSGHRMPEEGGALAWTAAAAARVALSTATIDSAEHAERAAAEAGQATDVWRSARMRTKALEHLEDRHRTEVLAAGRDAEQRRLDEHTTTRPPAGDGERS
jgi:flagellar FliJ protein